MAFRHRRSRLSGTAAAGSSSRRRFHASSRSPSRTITSSISRANRASSYCSTKRSRCVMAVSSLHQSRRPAAGPGQPHPQVIPPALEDLRQLPVVLAQHILAIQKLLVLLRQQGPGLVQTVRPLPQLRQFLRRGRGRLEVLQASVLQVHGVPPHHRLVAQEADGLMFNRIDNIGRHGGGGELPQGVQLPAEALYGILDNVLAVLPVRDPAQGLGEHQPGIAAV